MGSEATIDTLAIEIEANAMGSVDGVRKLSRALTSLSKSISSVNGAGISNVASSLNTMSGAFNNVSASSGNATSGTRKYTSSIPSLISHTNRASHSAKSLAYHFGKFYANMFLIIRGMKALGKSVSRTMDYMESFNFWDVAINSASSKTSEWQDLGYEDSKAYADAFKKRLSELNSKMTGFNVNSDSGDISVGNNANLGINLTDLTTFQAEIVSITSSLGLCTQISGDTSKALSMLVADMSSLRNIDISTVMKNFQSGLIGQSRALYKYGIDITNATLQAYAYKNGVTKAVSEMTQAEKMQLRMLAILDQSKVAWGDLANTLNQPANQFRVLQNGVKNLAIIIGKLLMPMVSATLPYLNAMVKALQTFFTWVANILGIKLDVENTGIGSSDIFDDIEDSADDATDSVNALKKSLTQLGIDELNINNPDSSSGTGSSSIGGGVDLSTEINNALAEYEKVWEDAYSRVENKVQKFEDRMKKALELVSKIVKDFKIGDFFSAGKDTSKLIASINEFLSESINGADWKGVGSKIGDFLKGLDWTEIIRSGFELKFDIAKAIADVWFESFDTAPIETAILTALATMKFTGLGKVLTTALIDSAGLGKNLTLTGAGLALGLTIYAGIVVTDEAKQWLENIKMFGWDMGRKVSANKDSNPYRNGTAFFQEGEGTWIEQIKKWQEANRNAREEEKKNLNEFESFINDKISGFVTGSFEKLDSVKVWMDENLFPLFSVETWIEKGTNIGIGIANSWIETKNKWNDKITDWWKNSVNPWFEYKKWQFDGIKEGLSKSWESAVEAVKEIWNKFANWLNEKLTWTIDPVKIAGKTLFGGATISLGKIPTFANGGITSADIFAANENGVPELIGTIGRKTAIASGTEVTGIADAVYSTAQEEIRLLREQNALLMKLLEKDTTVNIGDRDIARANIRGQKSLGMNLITEG